MSDQMTEAVSEADAGWPDQALDLSAEKIDDFLRRFNVVVIDCWVGWCKHSKHMVPIFDSLARDLTGKAVFGKVDAQEVFHFPVKYKVRATPTFLIFKKGELVDRLVGEQSREELEHAVRRHLDPLAEV
jgi:thioredoxin 1